MPGIYQVRGLDLSNVTFIEGEHGVIVIDPLVSVETAAAALSLYHGQRGERPVIAVIYTHSHVELFDAVAIQINGPNVWDERLEFDWVIDGDRYRVALANGVLTYRRATDHDGAARDATLHADRATFLQAMLAPQAFHTLTRSGQLLVEGDGGRWTGMLAGLDSPDPSFNIVLP